MSRQLFIALFLTASSVAGEPPVLAAGVDLAAAAPTSYPAERYSKVKTRSPFGTPLKKPTKVVAPDTLGQDFSLAGISAMGDSCTVFLVNRQTGEYLDLQADGGEKQGIRIIAVSDDPDLRKASVEIGRGEAKARITYDTKSLSAAPVPAVAAVNSARGIPSGNPNAQAAASSGYSGSMGNVMPPPGAPPSGAPALPAFLSGGPPQTSGAMQAGGPGKVPPNPSTRRRLVLPSIPGTPKS